MDLEFSGEIWEWRGPAPYYFVSVPEEESLDLQAVSAGVSYGWGMMPVQVRIGGTAWATSLWPKDGRYVLPLKAVVRRAERLQEGDTVTVRLTTAGPAVEGRRGRPPADSDRHDPADQPAPRQGRTRGGVRAV